MLLLIDFHVQLCNATPSNLAVIEERLQDSLARLKSRLEWLNSGR